MANVVTPYNFVPFSNKVCCRYESIEQLPPHDKLDPTLLTGEIEVSLVAKTPVFVSDGKNGFFRGANGKYMLPGSTVRGLLRENMQILSFGLIRAGEDFDNYQIYFREMAGARNSTAGDLKKYYQNVLDVPVERKDAKTSQSTPGNVKAGYLRNVDGKYYIQPIKGRVFRVSRQMKDVGQFGTDDARTVQVGYTATGDRVSRICPAEKAAPDMEKGVLLYTGKPVRGKPNALYLFPAADDAADPIHVSEDDILSYREDFKKRSKSLQSPCGPQFWALPEDGKEKAVFYLEHNGHVFFGRARFLRIAHEYYLAAGLPENHKKLAAEREVFLDYPHAMFGFATTSAAYRSRVSVGDFPAEPGAQPGKKISLVLSEPKPGYYAGYVEDGMHYSQEDFHLRGYKQYWLKKEQFVLPQKENVKTNLQPMPAGTKFSGTVRFQNLHEDELGLLLWALRLEEGCYQPIGMAKPYGFGRMQLCIDRVRLLSPQKLYQADGLCDCRQTVADQDISRYIQVFDSEICQRLNIKKAKGKPSVLNTREIKDFLYIRQTLRKEAEVRYMELAEYKNTQFALPTVADEREKNKPKENTPSGVPDLSKMNAMQRAFYEAEQRELHKKHL